MTAQTSPKAPLPIATKQTARGLIRIYARLKGELAKANDGEEVMVPPDQALAAMEHIAALMPLLGTEFVPSKLRPLRTRPHIGPLGYGDVRSGVLAALRHRGGWMTYNELADAVLRRNRLTLSPEHRRHFLQKLREATHALRKQGLVEPEHNLKLGDHATEQRWRLRRIGS